MPVPTVKTRFSSRNKADEESNTSEEQPSASLPRPSLLAGPPGQAGPQLPSISPDADSLFPPRPRRLWKVSDTRLNALPAGFPPVDPRCSVYVADAPPSVVAVRIAEALRRLSVAVEYDEETPCATCWTADRCHFVVQLWQGPKSNFSVRANEIPDLSAGILVEGMRLSGSVITFHRMIRTILAAALSHDTGDDRRTWKQTNSSEFPRWVAGEPTNPLAPCQASDPVRPDKVLVTLEALEEVAILLEKDRHDAQSLGMERLVQLTDVHTVGVPYALVAAQSLLGVPPVEDPSSLLLNLHTEWMMGLLLERRLPNEKDQDEGREISTEKTAATTKTSTQTPSRLNRLACSPKLGHSEESAPTKDVPESTTVNDEDNESARVEALLREMREERALTGDANHAGLLRGLLMRVWANSLQVLHIYDHVALTTLLQHQTTITSRDFLEVLIEDAEGCSRPPMAAVMGTRLASPHEAVWAVVCLRLLSQHSTIARKNLERTTYEAVLDKALMVGSATHSVLEQEANFAMETWNEKHHQATSI